MKEMICIICPNGCHLQVDEQTLKVDGAKCQRGIQYALQEMTKPMRMLCTTVRTIFPDYPVLSVRTNKEVEKKQIFSFMNEINQFIVTKRVHLGEVIIANIFDSSIDLIATTEMDEEKEDE